MKILVLGGTRFFGIHMVNALLDSGHDVTIATRGIASDIYGDKVKRVIFERTKAVSVKNAIEGIHYDVVIDKIAYCSVGDTAPYNGEPEYSINTNKAEKLGFLFSYLNDWIFDLLDYYINLVNISLLISMNRIIHKYFRK